MQFGGDQVNSACADVVMAANDQSDTHPSRHVTLVRDGDNVTLKCDDGEVCWNAKEQRWILFWR